MTPPPYFSDDVEVTQTLANLCSRWVGELEAALPALNISSAGKERLGVDLCGKLAELLLSPPHSLIQGPQAFGDPFLLEKLPLPRKAVGYGLQQLDHDLVFDRATQRFLSIRTPLLQPVFQHFPQAYAAGKKWLKQCPEHTRHTLAIVPLGYDPNLERHILIYGVLKADYD